MQPNDGPDFRSEVPRLPIRGVITELEIDAVEEGVITRGRTHKKFPQLDAVESRTATPGDAVHRQIQPLLEPGRDSEGKLGDAVVGTIGDDRAWKRRLLSPVRRKVRMPHQLNDARFDNLSVVDLDLVRLRKADCGRCK